MLYNTFVAFFPPNWKKNLRKKNPTVKLAKRTTLRKKPRVRRIVSEFLFAAPNIRNLVKSHGSSLAGEKCLGRRGQILKAGWLLFLVPHKRYIGDNIYIYIITQKAIYTTVVYKWYIYNARWWFQIFFLFSPRFVGRWSNLTSIFFGWVETTNYKGQQPKGVILLDVYYMYMYLCIGSMYGPFTSIWLRFMENVGECAIHGSYMSLYDIYIYIPWKSLNRPNFYPKLVGFQNGMINLY